MAAEAVKKEVSLAQAVLGRLSADDQKRLNTWRWHDRLVSLWAPVTVLALVFVVYLTIVESVVCTYLWLQPGMQALGLLCFGWWLVLLVLLRALRGMINIVQQGEVGVVKRLGEYRKTHEPGLVVLAPFIDSFQRVDIRETPIPGDRQEVITKDNVVVSVNATIFTQVVDAKQALFSIANFDIAIDAVARTALRSVIGTLSLDQALSERERINGWNRREIYLINGEVVITIHKINAAVACAVNRGNI